MKSFGDTIAILPLSFIVRMFAISCSSNSLEPTLNDPNVSEPAERDSELVLGMTAKLAPKLSSSLSILLRIETLTESIEVTVATLTAIASIRSSALVFLLVMALIDKSNRRKRTDYLYISCKANQR